MLGARSDQGLTDDTGWVVGEVSLHPGLARMVSLTRGRLRKGLKASLTAAGAAQACDPVPAIPKSGKLDNVRLPTQGHSSKPRVPVLGWRHMTPGALGAWQVLAMAPPQGALGLQASPGQCTGEAGYAVLGLPGS